MYSYYHLHPTCQTSVPPAPPSPPLRIHNCNLGTDAYAEDEALDDIVVRPRGLGFLATTPCRSRTKSETTVLWERDYKGDGLHPEAGVAVLE